MLSSSIYAILMLTKTTSPKKLLNYDCKTLYYRSNQIFAYLDPLINLFLI